MFLRTNQRDRWLLTYADFITLLFATFVLMYAIARTKEQRTPPVQPVTPVISATPAAEVRTPPSSNLITDLRKNLQSEQQGGVVTISTEQRGIIISLDDRMCFRPGQAEVQAVVTSMFEKV